MDRKNNQNSQKQQYSKAKGRRNQGAARYRVSRKQREGDFGRKVSPPNNPPDTTSQPWWNLTLSSIRAPGDYTIDTLVTDFQAQLNNDKFTFNSNSYNSDTGIPFRAQFRFMGVDVWNLTGRIVSLTVWELPEQTYIESKEKFEEKDQLGSWVDCGGPSSFPAVGYRYPSSHHRRIYRPDPLYSDKKIVSTLAAGSDKILYHIHLAWKADGYPKFSSVQQSRIPILNQVRKATDQLVNLNKNIADKLPDTGNAISKVGDVIGSYVIPIAVAEGTAAHVASVACNSEINYLTERVAELELKIAELTKEDSKSESSFSEVREEDEVTS